MFSFLTQKKRLDATPHIRRLIDLTAPNRPAFEGNELRCENRYCRALPILLSPIIDNIPILSESFAGTTQEFSDSGLRLITQERLTADEYCASIWPRVPDQLSPLHIVCKTREFQQITANMWSTGLQVMWMLDIEDKLASRKLDQLARTYFCVSDSN
jgi:hypothetical protein